MRERRSFPLGRIIPNLILLLTPSQGLAPISWVTGPCKRPQHDSARFGDIGDNQARSAVRNSTNPLHLQKLRRKGPLLGRDTQPPATRLGQQIQLLLLNLRYFSSYFYSCSTASLPTTPAPAPQNSSILHPPQDWSREKGRVGDYSPQTLWLSSPLQVIDNVGV